MPWPSSSSRNLPGERLPNLSADDVNLVAFLLVLSESETLRSTQDRSSTQAAPPTPTEPQRTAVNLRRLQQLRQSAATNDGDDVNMPAQALPTQPQPQPQPDSQAQPLPLAEDEQPSLGGHASQARSESISPGSLPSLPQPGSQPQPLVVTEDMNTQIEEVHETLQSSLSAEGTSAFHYARIEAMRETMRDLFPAGRSSTHPRRNAVAEGASTGAAVSEPPPFPDPTARRAERVQMRAAYHESRPFPVAEYSSPAVAGSVGTSYGHSFPPNHNRTTRPAYRAPGPMIYHGKR